MAEICNFLDRKAITERIFQYCRSMDQLDPQKAQGVWSPDSFVDYGEDVFQGPGPDAMDFFCEMNRGLLHYAHHFIDMDLRINGNQADSKSQFSVSMWMYNDDTLTQITLSERCQDIWIKYNGLWCIYKRFAVIEFDDFREFTHDTGSETMRGLKGMPQIVNLWH